VSAALKLLSFVRPRATEPSVREPKQLARHINELADALEHVVALANAAFKANIVGSGVLLRNITVAAGVTHYFQHRLGRPYAGYFPTRIQTNAQTWKEMPLLAGMRTSTHLALQFSSAGTIDLYVF